MRARSSIEFREQRSDMRFDRRTRSLSQDSDFFGSGAVRERLEYRTLFTGNMNATYGLHPCHICSSHIRCMR
jgi:hypothetical protein